MAKDIKALQCPNCGSIYKTETKPDFYRCQNCGTEYYLDSDDVHVYHHHTPPNYSSAPPVNTKLPVYILIGAIAFMVVIYFVAMYFQPKKSNGVDRYSSGTYKMPRSYYSSFVYTNTASGEPVYLRLGTDQVDQGNNKTAQELHAQFNNALTGKLIADRTITDEGISKNRCSLTYKAYAPDMIFAIGCNNTLLQLDTRSNELNDVTKSIFKDFPQLSSGVARLDFDYTKAMVNVMNNEGESYYYFPTIKKLLNTEEEADKVWKSMFNRHYFEFGYLGDYFDEHKVTQLIEIRYDKITGQMLQRDLTPGRKYFNPKVLYHDDDHLLIVVNATAADSSPLVIERIDVQSGKLMWALPPDQFYLYSTSKWKGGFAIEYRKGDEADYAHGVMVVSDAGKVVNNYQLSRTE